MGIPVYDGDEIAHDGFLLFKGSATPKIKKYPRTKGGIVCGSGGIKNMSLTLNAYLIPPKGSTKAQVENFQNLLNEQISNKSATLTVNGNSYPNVVVGGTKFDEYVTNTFIRYTIDFKLGNQNSADGIRQLNVPDLFDFSRGRKALFTAKASDFVERTFQFYHNADAVRNLEVTLKQKKATDYQGSADYVFTGGFERIICQCWGIFDTRQSIEAYFYNAINGPLGNVGTLTLGGNTYNNAMLVSVDPGGDLGDGVNYTLEFLSPLQC